MLNSAGKLSQARMLFLSAHGYLDPENPERNAVVLARPTGGTEADRYLTARDIATLDLQSQLVLVSSCDSGNGRVAAGEGVLGLPYAFFSAGALDTILTLWRIYDDPATETLVSDFFESMKTGGPPDEALTAAKRRLRKSRSEAYWAPFFLIGR